MRMKYTHSLLWPPPAADRKSQKCILYVQLTNSTRTVMAQQDLDARGSLNHLNRIKNPVDRRFQSGVNFCRDAADGFVCGCRTEPTPALGDNKYKWQNIPRPSTKKHQVLLFYCFIRHLFMRECRSMTRRPSGLAIKMRECSLGEEKIRTTRWYTHAKKPPTTAYKLYIHNIFPAISCGPGVVDDVDGNGDVCVCNKVRKIEVYATLFCMF